MSIATIKRRMKSLEERAVKAYGQSEVVDTAGRFRSAVSKPGVWGRLHQIAEHGASLDDLEWLELQTKETGIDFPGVVEMLVRLEEEY